MTANCHPFPADARQDFLQLATRALCVRPGETPAEGAERTRHFTHMAMGLEPRDGLEYMLAVLIAGHFHLILDTMRDVFQGEDDAQKTRQKSNIAGLDRMTISLLRELRKEQERPLADARPHETAAAEPPPAAPSPAPREPRATPGEVPPIATPAPNIGAHQERPPVARATALAATSLQSGIYVAPRSGLKPMPAAPIPRVATALPRTA